MGKGVEGRDGDREGDNTDPGPAHALLPLEA